MAERGLGGMMEEKDWKKEERDMMEKGVLPQAADTRLGREGDPLVLPGMQEALYRQDSCMPLGI